MPLSKWTLGKNCSAWGYRRRNRVVRSGGFRFIHCSHEGPDQDFGWMVRISSVHVRFVLDNNQQIQRALATANVLVDGRGFVGRSPIRFWGNSALLPAVAGNLVHANRGS
jgi:hypothetical protein